MKRYLIFLLLVVGCSTNPKTYTYIENSNDYKISINYPITADEELNESIKLFSEQIYNEFIKIESGFYENELNISYDCNEKEVKLNIYEVIKNQTQEYFEVFTSEKTTGCKKQVVTDFNYPDSFEITSEKLLALTFDDGPSEYTLKIVELLKEYDSYATFFVVGNKVKQYDETIVKMLEYGHEIGNHSYDHKWLTRLNLPQLNEQLNKVNDLFLNCYSYEIKYLRPTYGSVNNFLRKNTELEIVKWTIDSDDWKVRDSGVIAKRVYENIENYDIILFHDIYERTYLALEVLIPQLIADGYQLVTLSQLKSTQQLD